MDSTNNQVLKLRARIGSLQGTLGDLRRQLADAEADSNQIVNAQAASNGHSQTQPMSYLPVPRNNYDEKTFENVVDQLDLPQEDKWGRNWELTPEEYKRYGRQLIMPEIGLRGGPSFLIYDLPLSLI